MSETRILSARPRGRVARWSVGLSARANYAWALRCPGRAPFIMLTEFPRSGGNWIRDMLGDALQLPVPRFSRLPITFPALAHNHDHRQLHRHPAVYVVRDGRDVFLSHLDKTVTTFLDGAPALRRRILRLHPSLASLQTTCDRAAVDPMMFYHEWARRPLGSRVNWGLHVGPWVSNTPPNTVLIRYEDMRVAPDVTLAKAAERLADRPVPATTIDFAVARNSFEAQTGRKPGEIDPTSTKRSGLTGAWKTLMPPALQDIFARDFGDVLRAARYEV